MGEDIVFRPAGEVEGGAIRQEIETSGGKRGAAFAGEQLVHLILQPVEIKDVGGRIIDLLIRQRRRAPVRGLLLLRDFDAEKFFAQVLEPVFVGVCTHQFRSGARAVNRRTTHIQMLLDHAQIEAREMENLENGRVAQHGGKARRRRSRDDLHEMRITVAARKLHKTQTVTLEIETHRFGVDRDRVLECHIGRKVAAMEVICQRQDPSKGWCWKSRRNRAITIA